MTEEVLRVDKPKLLSKEEKRISENQRIIKEAQEEWDAKYFPDSISASKDDAGKCLELHFEDEADAEVARKGLPSLWQGYRVIVFFYNL